MTEKYGTASGNRYSISTTVFEAIPKNNRLFNRMFVEKFETDLIRNSKPTKSTEETHAKKLNKIKMKYPNIEEVENQ